MDLKHIKITYISAFIICIFISYFGYYGKLFIYFSNIKIFNNTKFTIKSNKILKCDSNQVNKNNFMH